MRSPIHFQRWGLAAKLIIPFVSVFVLAIAALGAIFLRTQSGALARSLEKKAEILVRNLATALSDPFAMGEYDLMQQHLVAAEQVDNEIAYAIVVGLDGRGVASTDTALRNQSLTRNEFEANALKLSDFTRRDTPTPSVFEVVMPVRFQGNPLGILRVGVSTQQVASTNEVVATTKEISVTSQALVHTMQEVASLSEETAAAAESGLSGLSRMEAVMQHMEGATRAIAEKLAVINKRTTNITSVVTTMTKVADQTKLLSLNAAIEAEQAGEYGRGFAVVAREIRRLADQTSVATLDIEQMVKEMTSAVSSGVMGMDQFAQEVRQTVEEVRTVGE